MMRRGALPSIVKPPLFLSPDNSMVSEKVNIIYRVLTIIYPVSRGIVLAHIRLEKHHLRIINEQVG